MGNKPPGERTGSNAALRHVEASATEDRRRAPHPEWVQMYRHGIPSPKIAADAGAAESTVRYHLHIAAQAEPSIREEHKAARGPVTRNSPAGVRNMNDTVAFYESERRLPSTKGSSARERAVGVWIHRRRQDALDGTLSPIYREGLSVVPDWDRPPTRKADDEARWHQRLAEVAAYRAAGNDWPRHQKADTKAERVLGVWLHTQRIKFRREELDQGKESLLNAVLPGWRIGRARAGRFTRAASSR